MLNSFYGFRAFRSWEKLRFLRKQLFLQKAELSEISEKFHFFEMPLYEYAFLPFLITIKYTAPATTASATIINARVAASIPADGCCPVWFVCCSCCD